MRIEQMHYQFKLGLDRVASNDRPDFMPWEVDEYLNKGAFLFLKERYSIHNETKSGFETNQKRISELTSLHIKSPEVQPAVVPINLGNGLYEVRLNELGNNISGQYFRYLFLTKGIIKISKDNCTKIVRHTSWQSDDVKNTYNEPSWDWCRVHANFGKSSFVTLPVVSPIVGDSMDVTADLMDNESLVTERYNNDQLPSLFLDTTDRFGTSQFNVDEVCLSYIKYPNRVFVGGYDHIDKHSTSATDPIHCDIDEGFHDEIVRLAVKLATGHIQDQIGVQISTQLTKEDRIL